jgi:hypothetical protein
LVVFALTIFAGLVFVVFALAIFALTIYDLAGLCCVSMTDLNFIIYDDE